MKKISVRSLIIPPIVVSIGVAMFSLGLLLLGIRILKPHSTTGLVVIIIGLFYGVISVLLFLDDKGYLSTTPTASTFRIGVPMISITVDGDLNPIIPSNLYLTGEGTEHRKIGKVTLEKLANGKLYANGAEVVRYLSPNQKDGNAIQGHKLRKELKNKQLLNACIMDALLANQQLIPEEWKSGFTYKLIFECIYLLPLDEWNSC